MRKMFKQPHKIMLYRERTESQEFGKPKKHFQLCTNCYALYFQKSWHHITPKNLTWLQNKNLIHYTRCPACTQIHDHQFEGELLIKNIPQKYSTNLLQLISNFTQKAYEMDCQHRLIGIFRDYGNNLIIQVTENQLAQKLAKKIREAFDLVDIEVSYSKTGYDTERVRVNFKASYT